MCVYFWILLRAYKNLIGCSPGSRSEVIRPKVRAHRVERLRLCYFSSFDAARSLSSCPGDLLRRSCLLIERVVCEISEKCKNGKQIWSRLWKRGSDERFKSHFPQECLWSSSTRLYHCVCVTWAWQKELENYSALMGSAAMKNCSCSGWMMPHL